MRDDGRHLILDKGFLFMTYEDQLQTEDWKLKRAEIIERDFGICQKCMSSKNLNVHHKTYIDGLMAWEYPDFYLVTLCAVCHKEEHEDKDISEFVNKRDLIAESFYRIKQSVWAWKELGKKHG